MAGDSARTTRFRGPFSALLTLAGVSIGLANVWRFPYMMGQNGGSAFLLVYLVMMALVAIPALAGEWALGRHTRFGTLGAFKAALGTRWGAAIGLLLVFGIAVADSYYMVVIGNVLYVTAFSVMAGFSVDTAEAYTRGLGDAWMQYGFALTVLAWGGWVIRRGLNRGIEAISRLFVPLFGAVMIYLVIFTLSLEGATGHVVEFLKPDFGRLGPREVFAAMGQACFSLGLGGTVMLVYGSYIGRSDRLLGKAALTGLTDAGAAVLAGTFLVPAVLVFGLSLASGPSLVFYTLPELFSIMPGARLAGSLFLAGLTLMAFLSAVAALEVCLRAMRHLFGERYGRGQLILALVGIEALLMVPSALDPDLIGILDLVFGSGFVVFGSAMALIGLAWGMGREVISEQFGSGRLAALLTVWLRFVVPAALLLVLVLYVAEIASGSASH